jgi:flagellar basal-body rod modification protein FlgD
MTTNTDNNIANTAASLGLSDTTKPAENRTKLGQSEFLKLMITEVQNQDPFNPTQNSDFIAQMAQFSSVTGLDDLNKSFNQLSSSLTSNQALQASTMVGRNVLVSSDQGLYTGTSAMTGLVNLPESSAGVKVNILDDTGQVIRSMDLGPQAAGDVPFAWDGLADDGTPLPAGSYTIAASAKGADGSTSLETFVNAAVESVTLNQQNQGVKLNLKDMGSVEFSKVREIM